MFLCLVVVLTCNEIKGQTSSYSVIDYKDISVCGVFLGSKKEKLVEMFGEPDTIQRKTNEFEGTTYYEYVYGKSVFLISANIFDGFEIRDRVYHLDKINLKIGDTIEKLKLSFPVSFKNRYQDQNATVVKVRIGETDSYILFHYIDNKISDISTWDDL